VSQLKGHGSPLEKNKTRISIRDQEGIKQPFKENGIIAARNCDTAEWVVKKPDLNSIGLSVGIVLRQSRVTPEDPSRLSK
jgi:hypothetical protein